MRIRSRDAEVPTSGDPQLRARAEAAERGLAPSRDRLVRAEHQCQQLRQELSATKEYLQSLVEQQDAANEELRSANEEILSSNEELQSTNEELQTAKEETQSANEELATLNEELHYRNVDLAHLNNDLINLLGAVNLPIVLVSGSDSDARVAAARACGAAAHVDKLSMATELAEVVRAAAVSTRAAPAGNSSA